LSSLIHWPTDDELFSHFPQCFAKHGKVKAIIDCTEVQTQRPAQTDTNAQLYSDYKQRHTYKILIACTPAGSISFVSKAAGGNMSDNELVKKSGFLDCLEKGDVIMADKGFRDPTDFILRNAKLITPEISKKGVTFTEKDNIKNAAIANSRIHVERAIGRLKEFKILKNEIPLSRIHLVDHLFRLCAELVNLQPILVPK
jgi:hypothetical protein